MVDEADERTREHQLLAIYLHDHRAGAAAGLQLVRRCRRHAGAGELAEMLAWLETQIDQDRRALDGIMEELDVRPSPLKSALSVAAERVGRLKLNGHLWKRSPLSTVLELEALAAAVTAKRSLWQSLSVVAERSAVGDPRRLAELVDRATVQVERVQAHHHDAARLAFAADGTDQRSIPDDRVTTGQTLASEPRDDLIDRMLEDAEGGIESSILDAPAGTDGTPI